MTPHEKIKAVLEWVQSELRGTQYRTRLAEIEEAIVLIEQLIDEAERNTQIMKNSMEEDIEIEREIQKESPASTTSPPKGC